MPLNLCISALKSLTITEKKKKKNSSQSTPLESRGSRYVRPRHRPSQRLCRAAAQLIRMTESQDEGPHVEAIMERGSCAGAIMEALVR